MAKKRVEVNEETPDLENLKIDTTPVQEEVRIPIQKVQKEEEMPRMETPSTTRPANRGLINCLRKERVAVKFVSSPNAMIQSKGHVLSGGMAESATRSYVVPLLSTGQYMNVLTNDEKNYLEYIMGLEPNALSVYKKTDNFWDDSNPKGIGRVTLRKQGNFLDLSNPVDYIKYKILLANKDHIARSLQELEDRPKATYQFVIISEDAEAKSNLSKMDVKKRCWAEYGKVENDKATLRVIIELLEGRPTVSNVKLDWLQGRVDTYIDKDPRKFLRTITDPYLKAKVLLKKGLDAGLISRRNDLYYLKQDGSPLCEMGEESTLTNAAKYISSPKHQELKFILEAKLKEE